MFSFRKLIEKKKKKKKEKYIPRIFLGRKDEILVVIKRRLFKINKHWSIVLACSMFKMFIDDTFYCERGRKASL